MPAWIYYSLAAAAFFLLVLWWRNRAAWQARSLAGVLALLLVVWLIDLAWETEGEQIHRKIKEMSAAVEARDVDGVFIHVADDFEFQGLDRGGIRRQLELGLASGQVKEVRVRRIEEPEFLPETPGTPPRAKVVFLFKVVGDGVPGGDVYYRCAALFVADPQRQWRLQGWTVSTLTGQPIHVPRLR